ncbi:MAG: hypothetical protein UHW86_08875 [Spirochaetota bacterium]|nr:hypothetical protein [Spirochaetota bacterium]
MTLFEQLQQATSEEDVKDAYIKTLKLKTYNKNIVDIQTKEIWFEAKQGYKHSTYEMFTQLAFYVNYALEDGEYIPPFLCVIDCVKAALMKTDVVLPLLRDKSIKIKWGKSASDVTADAQEKVSQYIGTHFVSYNIQHNEKEFIEAVHTAIEKGEIIRTQITPNNLKAVFDKWIMLIGREIKGVKDEDYALLFYADIMSDGTLSTHENLSAELLHKGTKPAFLLGGKLYELASAEGYRKFWAIYDRPPKVEYRNYLLERRDSLIPIEERSFKGAYYTPLHVVDKAYELLNRTLGSDWQRNYIVWDMCCGVGNLEAKHSNHRNIYMSTLDQADVDVMKAAKTCVAAQRFQYDYLNDDITDDGQIDYSLSDKVPQSLRKAINEAKKGNKKILVLINPPYAEAGSGNAKGQDGKKNVSKSKCADFLMNDYGKATNELFTQFIARISKELPNVTLAMFSTLKYINAPNFEDFRKQWNAKYLDGFVVHSKAFDGLKGDFPIGFLIWQTNNFENAQKTPITEISCEVLDKNANPIGEKKFYNLPAETYLTKWIKRPKANGEDVVALKNALTVSGVAKWSDNAIGSFLCDSNDLQNAGQATALFSSTCKIGHKGTCFVTPENLWQVAVVFTVRQIVRHFWKNHNDQFLIPNKKLDKLFINDCLIWTLFAGKNLTASADGLIYDNHEYSITNHFIPFTETEVNASERFESDFMTEYMADKVFSQEALAVLDEGKKIYQEYFAHSFNYKIREEYKLNRSDVGWYQIRMALKALNESGECIPVCFTPFEQAYKNLSEKLLPQVWEYGFLK